MKSASLTMQLVTGSPKSLDEALRKLQENFSYVSRVMLIQVEAHPLDVSGPLFGVFLDVPNIPWTAGSDGDFFVPLGLSHRPMAEQWFDDVIASLEHGELASHSVLLKQAYLQGPGAALDVGDDSKVILKDQRVSVLKYWERPDDSQADSNM